MLKHFLTLKCLLIFAVMGMAQTCDLELTGYTPPPSGSGLHTFTVSFTNAENCGCNEFTQADGNNCDESTSTHVQNNETVSHIVFGIHYVNEETGEDYGENTDCTSTTFHPGWAYVLSTAVPPAGFSTGSFSTFAVNTPFAWDCILENPIEGYCWEVVIWQINLSQTADIEDFPTDGWSNGNSFNNTQMYPDIDISNNVISWCPDLCESDTIVEYITDTIYVDNYIYEYDTITQYVNLYDTLYVDNYIYDTVYVEVPVLEYIYLTDTITEYILQEIWIDCETGLECTEEPPGMECPDGTTIYAANTFTPNQDGINDVWKLIYDSNCWVDVEFWIFNRWGSLIYHDYGDSFEDYPYWDGANVADGVYIYTFKGRRRGRSEVIKKSGHITVFR